MTTTDLLVGLAVAGRPGRDRGAGAARHRPGPRRGPGLGRRRIATATGWVVFALVDRAARRRRGREVRRPRPRPQGRRRPRPHARWSAACSASSGSSWSRSSGWSSGSCSASTSPSSGASAPHARLALDPCRAEGRRALAADRARGRPAGGRHLARRRGRSSEMAVVLALCLRGRLRPLRLRRRPAVPSYVGLGGRRGRPDVLDALTAALALFVPGTPQPADFAWALLAGVGSGIGTGFLYRGFSAAG